MSRLEGFTLVEILGVVILLGILAAVVIPQFASSATDARAAALRADLKTIRTQIEIYRLHHDMYPGQRRRRNGSLGRWNAKRFVLQLLGQTDVDGIIGRGDFGPYMQRFPANSFAANPNKAAMVRRGQPNGRGRGWAFDPNTGEFHANDADPEHRSW